MPRTDHNQVFDGNGNMIAEAVVVVPDPPDVPDVLTEADIGTGPGKVAPGDHERIIEPLPVAPAARAAAGAARTALTPLAAKSAASRSLTETKTVQGAIIALLDTYFASIEGGD